MLGFTFLLIKFILFICQIFFHSIRIFAPNMMCASMRSVLTLYLASPGKDMIDYNVQCSIIVILHRNYSVGTSLLVSQLQKATSWDNFWEERSNHRDNARFQYKFVTSTCDFCILVYYYYY